MGAQIAVWSFVIRYAMQQLHFDAVIAGLGSGASTESIIAALRGVEPVAAGFYDFCAWIGLDDLLPRTAEQAGATYYILSLVLFVVARFVCTGLMRFFSPRKILMTLAALAVACCLTAVYARGVAGVYGLMGISGCMSLMFPTIYSCGLRGLGPDTKIGGRGNGHGDRRCGRADPDPGHRLRPDRKYRDRLLGSCRRLCSHRLLQYLCM